MAPATWSGMLSFGLVNVPVRLASAVRDGDPRFNRIHAETRERLYLERFCKLDEHPLADEDIVRGFELPDGEVVVISDEELAAVQPERTRTITIEQFTPAEEVDPLALDRSYLVVPDSDADAVRRAYVLLAEAMGKAGVVAIGRFVLRSRDYLVAIRLREGVLVLHTLLFADELLELDDPAAGRAPAAEVKQAVALIEALGEEFDPAMLEDRHRKRLLAAIDAARAGHEPKSAPEPDVAPSSVPDLMGALKRSIDAVRERDGNKAGTARRTRAAKQPAKRTAKTPAKRTAKTPAKR